MRAILLAAGVGSRIASEIEALPKSLLQVGDEPLIARTVRMLRRNHMEVTVITGYKHIMLEEVLAPFEVDIVYNPFFKVTNSMGSLWCAREKLMGDEIMIANADVFYEQSLLDKAFECPYETFLINDSSRVEQGDYFFRTEGDVLKAYGKELACKDRDSEYVGFAFLRNEWIKKFRTRLAEMVERGDYNLWWENVLYSFVDDGVDVHTLDIAGEFWAKVDTLPDYERIKAYIARSQTRKL